MKKEYVWFCLIDDRKLTIKAFYNDNIKGRNLYLKISFKAQHNQIAVKDILNNKMYHIKSKDDEMVINDISNRLIEISKSVLSNPRAELKDVVKIYNEERKEIYRKIKMDVWNAIQQIQKNYWVNYYHKT